MLTGIVKLKSALVLKYKAKLNNQNIFEENNSKVYFNP